MFSSGNNLQQLVRMKILVAVIREGGVAKAAAALGLSKSNVSKQLTLLEEELAVRLLSRNTRSLRPTEAGEIYYERCLEVMRLAEAADAVMASMQKEPVGRVKISVPVSFGREFLEPPLSEYLIRFPKISIWIDVTDRASRIVEEGVDLAIRVGEITDSELVVRKLCKTRHLVVASPEYLAQHGTPIVPHDLKHHECLLYENDVAPERWQFGREKNRDVVVVTGRIHSNNGDMLAGTATAGLGLARLPEFIVRSRLQSGKLISVLDSECHETTLVSAVLPARQHVPLKVRELIGILQATLGGKNNNSEGSSRESNVDGP